MQPRLHSVPALTRDVLSMITDSEASRSIPETLTNMRITDLQVSGLIRLVTNCGGPRTQGKKIMRQCRLAVKSNQTIVLLRCGLLWRCPKARHHSRLGVTPTRYPSYIRRARAAENTARVATG